MSEDERTVRIALASAILEERTRAGLTQAALAERAGVHTQYISQIERGLKSPTVRVLMDLARAMGTQPHLLLKRMEELLHGENSKDFQRL